MEEKLAQLDNMTRGEEDVKIVRQALILLYARRESMIRQKSRMDWLQLGDGNTRFFHQVVQKRKCRNQIRKIYWNSGWLHKPEEIKEAFFKYYSDFFKETNKPLFNLGTLPLPSLSEQDKKT